MLSDFNCYFYRPRYVCCAQQREISESAKGSGRICHSKSAHSQKFVPFCYFIVLAIQLDMPAIVSHTALDVCSIEKSIFKLLKSYEEHKTRKFRIKMHCTWRDTICFNYLHICVFRYNGQLALKISITITSGLEAQKERERVIEIWVNQQSHMTQPSANCDSNAMPVIQSLLLRFSFQLPASCSRQIQLATKHASNKKAKLWKTTPSKMNCSMQIIGKFPLIIFLGKVFEETL